MLLSQQQTLLVRLTIFQGYSTAPTRSYTSLIPDIETSEWLQIHAISKVR